VRLLVKNRPSYFQIVLPVVLQTDLPVFMLCPVSCRYVRRMFTDEVLRDMVGSSEVVAEIEREWEQLIRDRNCLRQIFPNGNSKVSVGMARNY
jgi:molybdopterin biosynthesis enzyme